MPKIKIDKTVQNRDVNLRQLLRDIMLPSMVPSRRNKVFIHCSDGRDVPVTSVSPPRLPLSSSVQLFMLFLFLPFSSLIVFSTKNKPPVSLSRKGMFCR